MRGKVGKKRRSQKAKITKKIFKKKKGQGKGSKEVTINYLC